RSRIAEWAASTIFVEGGGRGASLFLWHGYSEHRRHRSASSDSAGVGFSYTMRLNLPVPNSSLARVHTGKHQRSIACGVAQGYVKTAIVTLQPRNAQHVGA